MTTTARPTAADALATLALIHAVRRGDESATARVWDSCNRAAVVRCLVTLVTRALAAQPEPIEAFLDRLADPAIARVSDPDPRESGS